MYQYHYHITTTSLSVISFTISNYYYYYLLLLLLLLLLFNYSSLSTLHKIRISKIVQHTTVTPAVVRFTRGEVLSPECCSNYFCHLVSGVLGPCIYICYRQSLICLLHLCMQLPSPKFVSYTLRLPSFPATVLHTLHHALDQRRVHSMISVISSTDKQMQTEECGCST